MTDANGFDKTMVRLGLHDILLCIQRDAVRHASTNDHEWGSVAEATAAAATEGKAVLVPLPPAKEPAEDRTSGGAFAQGRNQSQNVKAVIADVLGHGNEKSMLPGQLEATWAAHTAKAGGLLFSAAEIAAFNELATEARQPLWKAESFKTVTI